jgi:hypothetical protein
LKVAPEKTKILRFSRLHPGMKRLFAFLGFELYWYPDRQGTPRVKRRTARNKLLSACRRIKEWIRENRHLPGRQFIKELNRQLQGHYQYYGIRGNSESLYRYYRGAKECAFNWLNRRGGKKSSFTWEAFTKALERLGIAPRQSLSQSGRMGHLHNDFARRESEYSRGTGCGTTARPGLCGGILATGERDFYRKSPHSAGRTGKEVIETKMRLVRRTFHDSLLW